MYEDISRLRCRSFRIITWSSKSRRQLPTQRSATPFCQGLRKAVRVGSLPISFAAETTSAQNFASRSNSKNLCGCLYAHASRNCCTIQSACGLRVTLKCRILRRSWLIAKKQFRTPNVSVGTVKKSTAAMASRWFLRNVSHCFIGSLGARRIHCETLLSETSKPSLSSSPSMRGAPQVGFSATIRKIRARISLLTPFRPPSRRNLEIHVQYKRNPAPCQFTTLRGVTKTRGFLHPDQNVLNATQNSLCMAVNRVRGRCACKASSCRRRAKFSRTRSSRERKELRIHPRRCRSDTIMARILSELSEFSVALGHSFCRCTTFWRDTALVEFAGRIQTFASAKLSFWGWMRFWRRTGPELPHSPRGPITQCAMRPIRDSYGWRRAAQPPPGANPIFNMVFLLTCIFIFL